MILRGHCTERIECAFDSDCGEDGTAKPAHSRLRMNVLAAFAQVTNGRLPQSCYTCLFHGLLSITSAHKSAARI